MKKMQKVFLSLLMLVLQINLFSQFYDLPIQYQKDYIWFDKEIQKSFKDSKSFSHKDTSLRLFTVFYLHPIDTITKEEYTNGSFLKKLRYGYVLDYKNKNKSSVLPKDSIVYANITVYSSKTNSLTDYLFDYVFIASFSYRHMRFFNIQETSKYIKHQDVKRFLNYRRDKRRISKKPNEEFSDINRQINWLRINDRWGGSATHQELRKYMWDKGNFFIFKVPEIKNNVLFIINEQLEIFVFFNEANEYDNYKVLPIKEFIDKHWDCFSHKESGYQFLIGC
jgi:hypothetical protein